jgi:glycosyltransferase involved in cell wall biosynthesis
MPSLVETVGLPMLEAAAQGTPVIAADRPYAHDVCGSAALFFDPLDPLDLAAKVQTLLSEPGLRERMVNDGRENVARRAAARPYDRMVEIALGATSGGSQ